MKMYTFAALLIAGGLGCDDAHDNEHTHSADMSHQADMEHAHDLGQSDVGADAETPGELTIDGWTVSMTAEDELKSGAEVFHFMVMDDTGAVEPTAFEVDAWMPDHGHGTNVPTTVTSTAPGMYEATVTFTMPGKWDIRVTTDADRYYVFPVVVAP